MSKLMKCKLRPDFNTCCYCIDEQEDNNERKDCDNCHIGDETTYTILGYVNSLFGKTYALLWPQEIDMYESDYCRSYIMKVPISRIKHIWR